VFYWFEAASIDVVSIVVLLYGVVAMLSLWTLLSMSVFVDAAVV